MKYLIFAVVSLCAFTSPSLAMDGVVDSAMYTEKRVVFLYIANSDAADFYEKIVNVHHGKLDIWRRLEAKNIPASKFKKLMDETGELQALYKTIKKALKKCDAKQRLLHIKGAEGNSLIVAVTLQKPKLVKKMVKRCDKSSYVYGIYTDGEKFENEFEYEIAQLKDKEREKVEKLIPYCKSDEKSDVLIPAANSHDGDE